MCQRVWSPTNTLGVQLREMAKRVINQIIILLKMIPVANKDNDRCHLSPSWTMRQTRAALTNDDITLLLSAAPQ